MRTNISTLVALDTVVCIPYGYESGYTALLVLRRTCGPCTVLNALEGADGQQVAVLSVDRTNDIGNELGLVAEVGFSVCAEVAPCGVNSQLLVLAAAVNSSVVLVHHILALLAIRLHDEVLHLFYGFLYGDYLCDTEECRLENGVGAVAQANLLCNLGGVDIEYLNVVVSEVFLHFVRQVLSQFLAFPDGVQEEGAALLQAAGNIVHVQISLYVASHEVRGSNEVSGVDRLVSEAEVRAGEAAGFLRVVGEISLAVLVGGVADDFY